MTDNKRGLLSYYPLLTSRWAMQRIVLVILSIAGACALRPRLGRILVHRLGVAPRQCTLRSCATSESQAQEKRREAERLALQAGCAARLEPCDSPCRSSLFSHQALPRNRRAELEAEELELQLQRLKDRAEFGWIGLDL